MKELVQISVASGFHFTGYREVSGGDINRAYKVSAGKEKFFLKLNDAKRFPGMLAAEAKGLDTLRANTGLKVPQVIGNGIADNTQYILMEWLESGTPKNNFWEEFGSGVAAMHRRSAMQFGLNADNYIGSLPQHNTQRDTWAEFYATQRILPLAKQLQDAGIFNTKDIADAEALCAGLSKLFPEEPAALLHGDLWSGNFLIAKNGIPAIFDPAVYYGHREMDIGMSLLFGGFDSRFYKAYNDSYPLERDWQKRVDLTQLYPLLVHAVLFGGHYIQSCKNIIGRYK